MASLKITRGLTQAYNSLHVSYKPSIWKKILKGLTEGHSHEAYNSRNSASQVSLYTYVIPQ